MDRVSGHCSDHDARITRVPNFPTRLAALVPLLLTLVACGDDCRGATPTGGGLDAVTIRRRRAAPRGHLGRQVSVDKVETETLVTGDGEEIEEGDQVLTHLWIGNGFTQETALQHLRRGDSPS